MDGKGKITVRCKDLCKTFYAKNRKQDEENEVIRNLNLEVRENEFLVLFGPGQCGKTTILNLMAGLVEPTSGEIEVNGKKVDGPSKDRGMVSSSDLSDLSDFSDLSDNQLVDLLTHSLVVSLSR